MKDRERPGYIIVDGHRLPNAFSEEVFKSGLSYEPTPTDVFVVTFPKCGTHWVSQIILAVMENIGLKGQPPLNPGKTFLERMGLAGIEALPHPRVITTHLPYRLIPSSKSTKYVYMARNPKDCCVSFYNHTKTIPNYGFTDGTFDEFFEIFVEGLTDFGNYYDNLKSWYEHRDDDNVLFLTYESMQADLHTGILKIAEFLDSGYRKALEDEEKYRLIAEKCSVESMKTELSKVRPDAGAFVRKGIVGDWKNYFSEEQSRRLEERFLSEVTGTDIPNLWKDVDWLTEKE